MSGPVSIFVDVLQCVGEPVGENNSQNIPNHELQGMSALDQFSSI